MKSAGTATTECESGGAVRAGPSLGRAEGPRAVSPKIEKGVLDFTYSARRLGKEHSRPGLLRMRPRGLRTGVRGVWLRPQAAARSRGKAPSARPMGWE